MRQLLTLLPLLAVCSASNAAGALVHRYSFNGNVHDSIGSAHGWIVDGGEPNAVFADGMLDVSSNVGHPFSANQNSAYVELPGEIVANAYLGGVAGEMTVEMWIEPTGAGSWSTPFSVGSRTREVVDVLPGKYLQFYSTTNFGVSRLEAHGGTSPGKIINDTSALALGQLHHVAISFYLKSFHVPTNTYTSGVSLFIDGNIVGATDTPGMNYDRIPRALVWLGRSMWLNDPIFDGKYDEFRVYDNKLSAAEIQRNFALGPNAVPEPQSICLAAMSILGLARLAVRQKTLGNRQLHRGAYRAAKIDSQRKVSRNSLVGGIRFTGRENTNMEGTFKFSLRNAFIAMTWVVVLTANFYFHWAMVEAGGLIGTCV